MMHNTTVNIALVLLVFQSSLAKPHGGLSGIHNALRNHHEHRHLQEDASTSCEELGCDPIEGCPPEYRPGQRCICQDRAGLDPAFYCENLCQYCDADGTCISSYTTEWSYDIIDEFSVTGYESCTTHTAASQGSGTVCISETDTGLDQVASSCQVAADGYECTCVMVTCVEGGHSRPSFQCSRIDPNESLPLIEDDFCDGTPTFLKDSIFYILNDAFDDYTCDPIERDTNTFPSIPALKCADLGCNEMGCVFAFDDFENVDDGTQCSCLDDGVGPVLVCERQCQYCDYRDPPTCATEYTIRRPNHDEANLEWCATHTDISSAQGTICYEINEQDLTCRFNATGYDCDCEMTACRDGSHLPLIQCTSTKDAAAPLVTGNFCSRNVFVTEDDTTLFHIAAGNFFEKYDIFGTDRCVSLDAVKSPEPLTCASSGCDPTFLDDCHSDGTGAFFKDHFHFDSDVSHDAERSVCVCQDTDDYGPAIYCGRCNWCDEMDPPNCATGYDVKTSTDVNECVTYTPLAAPHQTLTMCISEHDIFHMDCTVFASAYECTCEMVACDGGGEPVPAFNCTSTNHGPNLVGSLCSGELISAHVASPFYALSNGFIDRYIDGPNATCTPIEFEKAPPLTCADLDCNPECPFDLRSDDTCSCQDASFGPAIHCGDECQYCDDQDPPTCVTEYFDARSESECFTHTRDSKHSGYVCLSESDTFCTVTATNYDCNCGIIECGDGRKGKTIHCSLVSDRQDGFWVNTCNATAFNFREDSPFYVLSEDFRTAFINPPGSCIEIEPVAGIFPPSSPSSGSLSETKDASESAPSSSNGGLIAGVVILAVLGVLLVFVGLVRWRRERSAEPMVGKSTFDLSELSLEPDGSSTMPKGMQAGPFEPGIEETESSDTDI